MMRANLIRTGEKEEFLQDHDGRVYLFNPDTDDAEIVLMALGGEGQGWSIVEAIEYTGRLLESE